VREFDEYSITEETLQTFEGCTQPRLKQIMRAVVRHLHDLARELELTSDEWNYAIDYLTRTGQICSDRRQEFVLLSDTLGVSMLVDAINNRVPAGATQSTVLGPFFVQDAPVSPNGADIDPGMKGGGDPLFVQVAILNLAGLPIESATVDVWHSDDDGFYDIQYGADAPLTWRARFKTGQDGKVTFWTTMPAKYPIPYDGPVGQMLTATGRHPYRPAHTHFMVQAPGYKRLITHIFVKGSQYLDSDAVFGVKESLIDPYPWHEPGIAPDGRRVDTRFRTLIRAICLPRLDQLSSTRATQQP
jgi:hydroxyquinol 1,2-dioxygenase